MKNTHLRRRGWSRMTFWAFGLGLVFLLTSIRAAESAPSDAGKGSGTLADLLARGALAEERGKVATALEYYREAVQAIDRQRPLMAQALLRLGKSYEMIGASESAEAVYGRLTREFSDQTALIKGIPLAYRQTSGIAGAGLTDPTRVPLGAMPPAALPGPETQRVEIDLENEERQVILETARRRLEKARARVETSHDEVLREEIRLGLLLDSSPMALPASVNAGPDYDAYRAAWRQARLTMKDDGPMLKKIEAQTREWIDEVFLPSIQTSLEGARRMHAEFQMRYDDEFARYRDLLEEYRDRDRDKKERQRAIAEEERQRAEEQARLDEEKARKLLLDQERSKVRFVMLGGVRSPGFYEVPQDVEIDLLQAIAMAGGFSDAADSRKVKVKRGEEVLDVSVKELMQNPKAGDFYIRSGDTVIVGEKVF